VTANRLISRCLLLWHGVVARLPSFIARAYLLGLARASRNVFSTQHAQQIRNVIAATRWPTLALPPMEVLVGNETTLRLVPHLGEFDSEVLFSRKLNYETAVFSWLERLQSERKFSIVEIGANVGVYSVFFGILASRGKFGRVVVFEPSPVAFERLVNNLAANVSMVERPTCFQMAVTTQLGWRRFYEPQGHLTNGSFDREFARKFSSTIVERSVLCVDPVFIDSLFAPDEPLLLKIDVEGHEPELMRAFTDFVAKRRPTLIVEVLVDTAERIKDVVQSWNYRASLITETGAEQRELYADSRYRDWLLEP
jgi:FkbM family methyltransferase